ncbi:MAG: LysR family transcriptional regulator [Kiloniellales bacterium]|jgi:DNA-binding transcriptional LysR family regulator|nr:LysR family transcriptional regulator [Kiloniellales bacterium]
MDWDKLRIFHAVAEAGSFTHAGERLNLSQSAVSRQISALENSLKVPLFHRHARGLVLTEQGDLLYRTAHDVFGKLAMAEAMLTDSKERPRGELRISTTVAFGSTWLAPRLDEFLETYPDIEVHLILTDRSLDLSMREADLAIRMTPPTQAELIQRHLLTVHVHVFASPGYIKRHGMPATPEDLDDHRVIVYGHDSSPPVPDVNWLLRLGRPANDLRQPSLTVNNVYAIMRAIQSGSGLGALPDFMAQNNDELVRVLPDLDGPRIDAYFVYPEELRASKRISVFRDFLLRKVAESRF